MDRDVQDRMADIALRQFLDDTVVDSELEKKFWENPNPDNGFLGLWFVTKLFDKRCYMGCDQELTHWRSDFETVINQENSRRTRKTFSNYKELDPFTDDQLDKLKWTFDVFLMELASQYLE